MKPASRKVSRFRILVSELSDISLGFEKCDVECDIRISGPNRSRLKLQRLSVQCQVSVYPVIIELTRRRLDGSLGNRGHKSGSLTASVVGENQAKLQHKYASPVITNMCRSYTSVAETGLNPVDFTFIKPVCARTF